MSSKKRHTAVKKAEIGKKSVPADSLAIHEEKKRLFLPVLLALTMIPLIVHLVFVNMDPDEATLLGKTVYGDFFSHAKATLLIIFAAVMLCIAVACRKKLFEKHDHQYIIYLIASSVFILFTFLSAVCSKYSSIAFWGNYDRAEGFVTLFCYMVLFLYAMYAYREETDYKHIVIALSIVVVIASILGIFQYFGHDLTNTDFGKFFTISPWDRDSVKDESIVTSTGTLYGTFYHYDYVGSFAAIVAPIFLILTIAAKPMRTKLALGGMTLLSLWLLFGSTSRAGIIGIIVAVVLGIVFFARIITRKWKISLSCLAVILVAAIALNFASKGKVFSRIPSLFTDISSVFQNSSNSDYLSQLPVKNVYADGNKAVIVTQQGDMLKASLGNNALLLKDGSGKNITVKTVNGKSVISDERFKRFGFSFVPMGANNTLGLAVMIDEQPQFYFRVESDSKLKMTNTAGTLDIDSMKTPPSFGFKGKEKLGSARGYIWSRAIPMIPENLILGSGPDTFLLNFPQNDLLGKYWAYGTTNMVVDKPHNLYLQILLSDGGIALAAFLVIVLLYIVDSIRLYALKKEYQMNQIFGAAACLGVVGYLFAGLFNDSIVSVAPVFWIILGVGIAVNFRNRRNNTGTFPA